MTVETPRVLLISESRITRRVVEMTLADQPVELVTATSSQDGLAAWNQHPARIVLADLTTDAAPDGLALARHVRADRDGQPVAVILMAGQHESVDDSEVASAGVQAVIRKPLDSMHLIDAVRAVLRADTREAPATPPWPPAVSSVAPSGIVDPAAVAELSAAFDGGGAAALAMPDPFAMRATPATPEPFAMLATPVTPEPFAILTAVTPEPFAMLTAPVTPEPFAMLTAVVTPDAIAMIEPTGTGEPDSLPVPADLPAPAVLATAPFAAAAAHPLRDEDLERVAARVAAIWSGQSAHEQRVAELVAARAEQAVAASAAEVAARVAPEATSAAAERLVRELAPALVAEVARLVVADVSERLVREEIARMRAEHAVR